MKGKEFHLGEPLFIFDRTESTNDIASKLASLGFPHGTAVSAKYQTKGRGRLGRQWLSPCGENIYLSLILRPKSAGNDLLFLSLASALAVADAIAHFYRGDIRIKWPNDIFIKGKKVAGILIETKTKGSRLSYAILGIGINLNSDMTDLKGKLKSAGSVYNEYGKKIDKNKFLGILFRSLEKAYFACRGRSQPILLKRINSLLYRRGEEVFFDDGRKTVKSKIVKINKNGSLRLAINNLHKDYFSGEIIHS